MQSFGAGLVKNSAPFPLIIELAEKTGAGVCFLFALFSEDEGYV